nr:MAG TPA: hypothetical protein [Caudoviricetes sp.]DAP97885.1 MAG TPA: hypothetical protein [Caudoviricetes sp.]
MILHECEQVEVSSRWKNHETTNAETLRKDLLE